MNRVVSLLLARNSFDPLQTLHGKRNSLSLVQVSLWQNRTISYLNFIMPIERSILEQKSGVFEFFGGVMFALQPPKLDHVSKKSFDRPLKWLVRAKTNTNRKCSPSFFRLYPINTLGDVHKLRNLFKNIGICTVLRYKGKGVKVQENCVI